MNETIKELFQKAGGIVEVCDVTQDEVLTYTHEMDVEKFAQLIINECINYCGENLPKTVGGALKIHFGVK